MPTAAPRPYFGALRFAVLFASLVAALQLPAQVLYVGDSGDGTIRRVDLAGNVTTLATGITNPFGLAVDGAGNVYASSTSLRKIVQITPGGTVTDYATGFWEHANLLGLAFDASGDLYVADIAIGVYRITGGSVSVFASSMGYPRDLVFDAAGDLFVAGNFNPMTVYRVSSGTPAVFFNVAVTSGFTSIARDSSGNFFVSGGNSVIYKVTPGGAGSTFLTGYNAAGLALDPSDNLYFTVGSTLYVSTPAGVVSAFATGFNSASAVVYAAAVPEPSAFALALGLAATIAAVARARARQATLRD